MALKVHNYLFSKDRRLYRRSRSYKPIRTHNWEQGVEESLFDISATGCKLNTNLIYDIGDYVLISFPDKTLCGRIVRANHTGYGIRFET